MSDCQTLSIDAFLQSMSDAGLRRAYLVRDAAGDRLSASHPLLEPLCDFLAQHPDYHRHEAVFLEIGQSSGLLFAAFVHNTVRGAGQGGVRFWSYGTMADLLWDGLRLSRGMSRKNALAGLWWGGGKGIIARPPQAPTSEQRHTIFGEYGRFITGLRGCYVAAEDAGTTPPDMARIFECTRFATCIPPALGGSGNPSVATARGVRCAIEAAVAQLQMGSLSAQRLAVQGAGHVGDALIRFLLERGVRGIIAHDIDAGRCAALHAEFGAELLTVKEVSPRDTSIFASDADILAPCALGGVLNGETIPMLRAKVVCGAANNQLADENRDARVLMERGITFVPDFVANRMGIVNCADEQYGYLTDDPRFQRHFGTEWEDSIFNMTQAILSRSEREGTTPLDCASQMAEARLQVPHPIWGHRGRAIIESLVKDGWDGR